MQKDKIGFKESRISEKHYFEWRKNRAISCVNLVHNLINLRGKTVLDVGCGYGALSSLLMEKGATVYATETNAEKLSLAKKFVPSSKFHVQQVEGEILPFPNNYFDVVFLFDVIEHVKNPGKMIEDCHRLLKPGGLLYVEFTPYYSITGHHLYDFAKWPIHLLPREQIKKIVFSKRVKSYMTPQYYWDQFLSLNKLRIGTFQKMVKKGFNKVEERFIVKYPEVLEINLFFLNYLWFFKDYLTMSYEGLFEKNNYD